MNKHTPLVSILLPTYNQEAFIEEALNGLVCQTYPFIEILISDDGSVDNTFSLIENFFDKYKGGFKHNISKNNINLGISGNVIKLISMAKGDIIVFSAGDDISECSRVQTIVEYWNDTEKPVAVFSNLEKINVDGISSGLYFKSEPKFARTISDFSSGVPCWSVGASFAVDKTIFLDFPSVDQRILQEDGCFSFRALLKGTIGYIDKSLVKYRFHEGSASQHNSAKKRLVLQKNEYYMIKGWLNDALHYNSGNEELIKYLRNKCKVAYLKHFFFNTPLLAHSYNITRMFLKKVLKNN